MRRPLTPLRNGAGEASMVEGAMAGADDEIVWPLTGNDDLIAAGMCRCGTHRVLQQCDYESWALAWPTN
jgi:hypothetical protein